MLPRLSSRVHPRACPVVTQPSTSLKEKTATEYASMPSPSAPPIDGELPKSSRSGYDPNHRRTKWWYNHPRLSFVLLFVFCTYIGGIYVSTKITAWTLEALGVRQELTSAREEYIATSHMLNTMSECVDQSSLEYLARAKLQFEADSKRVQKFIDLNDEVIDEQRNVTMASSNDANTTLSCFSNHFYASVPETDAASSSHALVLAVRALLTTQAVTEANDKVSKQQTQLESQLLEMWNAVDSIRTSMDKTLETTNTLVAKQLNSLAPILTDSDGSGHSQQSASRLGRLSKVASSKLSDPLTSTSATSLGAIRKAGRTLHKALAYLSGLHEGFSKVMNTMDETWELLEKQLNSTVQQAILLQKELMYAAESTAQQINSTSTGVVTSFEQARQEISSSFDILRDHWQTAVKNLVQEGFTPWKRLGNQLVAELTANKRQKVRPESSIQRRSILPDRTKNSTMEQQRKRLHDVSSQSTTSSSASAENRDEFDIDTAVLRSSLVDIGAFVMQVVFYVDVGRLTLLVADLGIGLITESYSDMPMLDIRGLTTVDTIGSICEVFLCKHSLSAVCYTIVSKSSELARILVRFALVLFAASVVTVGLHVWKQNHISNCRSSHPVNSSQTVVQSITRAFFENSGNTSNAVADPLNEVVKYTTIINDSIHDDYAALELDSVAVWNNQSAVLNDIGDCAITTGTFVRMLQDCTATANNGKVALADDTSLSSQCLISDLHNASVLVSPYTSTEKMNAEALTLVPLTAFASCFPEDEVYHMERDKVVDKLQHSLACATERAVYLSFASWWLLMVIFIANRFIVRMVIKAAGVYWWRYLSANRLQFVGFCSEDGQIEAGDELPTAIQQNLREVKWRIIGRFIGIGLSFACIFTVLIVIFHGVI
ncbi:unnamed protein product [Phytophthora lilii]|uniref:Unnamed protein product n=1 Tax=Phytophthora lilii TaxID=2077276 RepID=A0A9W6THP4_9STRA|nr:unnamed protein product [Phytophthora lilii]